MFYVKGCFSHAAFVWRYWQLGSVRLLCKVILKNVGKPRICKLRSVFGVNV